MTWRDDMKHAMIDALIRLALFALVDIDAESDPGEEVTRDPE